MTGNRIFPLDHLMIETDDPINSADRVIERLGLPLAWPLTEKEEYTSIGVNFGDINLEFINFRKRFGIPGKAHRGFSGVAFNTSQRVEDAMKRFKAHGLNCRIGEECPAHTTVTIEEESIFPTVFLVKYHFDTTGWKRRLQSEFSACGGGTYHLGELVSLALAQELPHNIMSEFPINNGPKNQLIFKSHEHKAAVISDLIENLEIVIV